MSITMWHGALKRRGRSIAVAVLTAVLEKLSIIIIQYNKPDEMPVKSPDISPALFKDTKYGIIDKSAL